jgi:hypothetical protein
MNKLQTPSELLPVIKGIESLLQEWEPRLSELSEETITSRKNKQNRTIRQILGHMIDSASNNLHRIVHLQYQSSPFTFPNYASYGNNDRWIAIQNYQEEDITILIPLWKYLHLHLIHVIRNIDREKLENQWKADERVFINLKDMVVDFLRHFELHLSEIQELIDG